MVDGGQDAVLVRVAPVDGMGRQIADFGASIQSLGRRAEDIQRGITEATAVVSESLSGIVRPSGWEVETVAVKFGITLGAEGSVIVSKATFEASFEITVEFRRESSSAHPTVG